MGFMGAFLRLIYWFVILFDKVDFDFRCSKRWRSASPQPCDPCPSVWRGFEQRMNRQRIGSGE
jgi:hypothetical protein